jgi:SPX domain protein involved in polyphosphate accumulation
VKALEYGRYDINGYHFRTAKLEVSRPLTATTNSGVVENGEDTSGLAANYYVYFKNILEYMFGGAKELKVMFFECDWFDPVNNIRVDDFGMVEVKHESCYSGNNLLFTHQALQVYLSYLHESKKIGGWYIKLILKCTLVDMMHTWKHMTLVMSFMSIKKKLKDTKVSLYLMGVGLVELATHDVELMGEEPGPSKKCLQKSKRVAERQERRE